jgi:hypothetical protein
MIHASIGGTEMKRFSYLILVLGLLFLPGCLDNRPSQDNNGPLIENRNPPTKADVEKSLQGVKDDVAKHVENSQTAIQQNMQSLLGVSVGKITDDLVKATVDLKDLIHAEITTKIGEMNNHVSAALASNNDIRAMLKAQVDLNAKIQADLSASITANAQLQAQLDMKNMLSAQVGFNDKLTNTISDFKQTLSAGHDVVNNTISFTKDNVESLKNANAVAIAQVREAAIVIILLCLIIAAAVSFCFYVAWGRAENRCVVKDKECQVAQAHLTRAMGMMAPDNAKNFFQGPAQ